MKILIFATTLFVSFNTFASQPSALKTYLRHMAAAGKPSKAMSTMAVRCNPQPNGPSCLNEICAKGGYNCDIQNQLASAAQLCKGVEGSCIDDVCAQGGYNCDIENQLASVAQLCVNVHGLCVKSVCAKGGYNCDIENQLASAVQLCQNVEDSSCIDNICNKGGYNCDIENELASAVKLCQGN